MHPVFTEAPFTTAKTGQQLKCPLIKGQMKKRWCIHTMEYISVIKSNEIMLFAATWMDLEIIMLSEVSQKEKYKYHMIPLIRGN